MVRLSAILALSFAIGLGCGKSGSETKSETPAQSSTTASFTDPSPASEATLYSRAQEAEQQGHPDVAVQVYRRILTDFPSSPDNYKAVFLIGFVFSEKLNMPDSARIQFQAVIKDYPNCEFVDDAQAMLRFLDGEMPPFEDAPHS